MNKCSGCGVALQVKDKEKLGYVTQSALDKGNSLCMRCFNIVNYTKNINKDYTDEQFIEVLKKISTDNLIVMIVDVFDLNSTLLSSIIEVIKNHDILLFVNKLDMLPNTINIDKLLSNIVRMYQNLNLNIVNGTLISAKYNFNIDYAKELIDMYAVNKDTYIVGVSNVGKSQFLSALLKECEIENANITISHFPATTINSLKFKYNNNFIYDTPGVINRSQIIHYIKESDIKYLYPKKLAQKVFQVKDATTIFVSGYLKIDIESKKRLSLTLFSSEELNIHRRKTVGSEDFFKEHRKDILVHNYVEDNFKTKEIALKKDQEISVHGLCWFKVNEDCKISLTLNENVGISIRDKLI